MKKSIMLTVALAVVTFAACGGGGGGGAAGLNNAKTVAGTVYSASGDPVPGTTVYIPGTEVAAMTAKATRTYGKVVTASDGTECEDPPAGDSSLAEGCSAADGTFSIDTSAITSNPTQIVFQRGSLRMVSDLDCSGGDTCTLAASTTTFGTSTTWPKIAVVTGSYDRMEDVLAKLADPDTTDGSNGSYGRVCDQTSFDDGTCFQIGTFVYGSEYGSNLTVIDGGIGTTPVENTSELSYQTFSTYFDGTNSLLDGSGNPVFDVVFINCGNGEESTILGDPAAIAALQNYVNAGGRLYITDLSYDFVEQPFPQVMQFQNDPADPSTPGVLGAAEEGTDGVNLNAAVNSTEFSNWLQSVSVNRHDASTPGNPDDDCATEPYEQIGSALTSGGLIPLGDFLSGWAQMVGPHSGETPTIWISAGSGVVFDGTPPADDRPLTVSMDIGTSGGRVIYSSYHTAHTCPTLTFWPQERVLQYLIFSAF